MMKEQTTMNKQTNDEQTNKWTMNNEWWTTNDERAMNKWWTNNEWMTMNEHTINEQMINEQRINEWTMNERWTKDKQTNSNKELTNNEQPNNEQMSNDERMNEQWTTNNAFGKWCGDGSNVDKHNHPIMSRMSAVAIVKVLIPKAAPTLKLANYNIEYLHEVAWWVCWRYDLGGWDEGDGGRQWAQSQCTLTHRCKHCIRHLYWCWQCYSYWPYDDQHARINVVKHLIH